VTPHSKKEFFPSSPRDTAQLETDPSPGLRDRLKSSQDFTFGHPLPTNGRGRINFDRFLNFVVSKQT
jgi:hypothetical protein